MNELDDSTNSISNELMDIISEEVNIYHQELEIQNEELRRIQRELENHHNYFYSMFDEAPVGYAICDFEGVITRANTTFVTMINGDLSDILNHNISELVSEESQDKLYFFMKNLNSSDINLVESFYFKTNSDLINLKVFANTHKDHNLNFIRMAFIRNL